MSHIRKQSVVLTLLALAALALFAAACGGGGGATTAPAAPAAQKPAEAPKQAEAPKATEAPKAAEAPKPAEAPKAAAPASGSGGQAAGVPDYYPADYSKLVDASKNEKGLLVYSIMSEKNWAPVIKAFNAKYPWIKVDALDLGSYEVFERYYSESSGNARTADIIITSAPDAWQEFIGKGELATFKSAEDGKVPDWSKLAPSIYTVSSDPMVFIWNKALVKEPPKTMADLAAMVSKNPDQWKGKLTTYDAEKNATGNAIFWFWTKKNGDAGWKTLETLGKTGVAARTSAGNMVDAVISGENSAGFFVSLISVLPKFPAADPVLGWSLIGDGTPILTRGAGITKKAASPNSAQLFMDFLLSAEGQKALAEGGLTAYRPDVADSAKLHLTKLQEQVGQQNLIPFSFDPDLKEQAKKDAFVAKWKQTFGR